VVLQSCHGVLITVVVLARVASDATEKSTIVYIDSVRAIFSHWHTFLLLFIIIIINHLYTG
jgi:hypothetical protein